MSILEEHVLNLNEQSMEVVLATLLHPGLQPSASVLDEIGDKKRFPYSKHVDKLCRLHLSLPREV